MMTFQTAFLVWFCTAKRQLNRLTLAAVGQNSDSPGVSKNRSASSTTLPMQALGACDGGRMLFLGLGTGLGSTLILDDIVVPLELGELRWARGHSLQQVLGKAGLKRLGIHAWNREVHRAVTRLAKAFGTDYVVVGGGNVELLKKLSSGARRGSNDDAFRGGAGLWGLANLKAQPRRHTWVIV
jgi:hypothetical protein